MMDCTHYRRALMAQPHDPDPALGAHRESCRECNLFTERLLRFESQLGRAMRVALPAVAQGLPQRFGSPRPAPRLPYRRGWLAMAASILLAAVVAGVLWLSVSGRSLAADVVTHMAGEPQAWRRTDEPVPGPALQAVLRDSHLRLAAGAGIVSYAASCGFRGHHVPHLVIQTESGPVTVMVLVHERASKPVQFDEQGYRGVIVPVPGHGSLAVLTRGAAVDPAAIDRIAHQVQGSIVWTG
jgi:Protein of unknown function (DUF3379)